MSDYPYDEGELLPNQKPLTGYEHADSQKHRFGVEFAVPRTPLTDALIPTAGQGDAPARWDHVHGIRPGSIKLVFNKPGLLNVGSAASDFQTIGIIETTPLDGHRLIAIAWALKTGTGIGFQVLDGATVKYTLNALGVNRQYSTVGSSVTGTSATGNDDGSRWAINLTNGLTNAGFFVALYFSPQDV